MTCNWKYFARLRHIVRAVLTHPTPEMSNDSARDLPPFTSHDVASSIFTSLRDRLSQLRWGDAPPWRAIAAVAAPQSANTFPLISWTHQRRATCIARTLHHRDSNAPCNNCKRTLPEASTPCPRSHRHQSIAHKLSSPLPHSPRCTGCQRWQQAHPGHEDSTMCDTV